MKHFIEVIVALVLLSNGAYANTTSATNGDTANLTDSINALNSLSYREAFRGLSRMMGPGGAEIIADLNTAYRELTAGGNQNPTVGQVFEQNKPKNSTYDQSADANTCMLIAASAAYVIVRFNLDQKAKEAWARRGCPGKTSQVIDSVHAGQQQNASLIIGNAVR